MTDGHAIIKLQGDMFNDLIRWLLCNIVNNDAPPSLTLFCINYISKISRLKPSCAMSVIQFSPI